MISDIRRVGLPKLPLALALAIAFGPLLLAGETAILANGFQIHADRHEVTGDNVKLFSGGGFTELPLSQIAAIEPEPCLPPSPSAGQTSARSSAPQTAGWGPIDQPLDPKRLAADAARRNNLPEALIRCVMHAESGYRADAISPKGAMGLMQLMPATAQVLHADPRDPKQNVEAGTAYLRSLLLKYESKDDQVARALAAYNAGPAAVDRYNGVPPYRETRNYVFRVLTEYQRSLIQPAPEPAKHQ